MKRSLFLLLIVLPTLVFSQRKRAIELLGGAAFNDGSGGYHVSVAAGPQWKHFGMATYTAFMNTPSNKFSNWTIIGLQFKPIFSEGPIRPYGIFDFGLFNFQTINDKVNMRTASFDLGGGIDKELKNGNGLLIDARWKWLVDYGGERATIGIFTLNAGLRF